MPESVFWRIPLSYVEKADTPNEQMCFCLACLSVFEWSTIVGKLSGTPREGRRWEHFPTLFCQEAILKF